VTVYLVGHCQNERKPRGEPLDPSDPGSAGQRLFLLSGLTMDDYLRAFVRVNAQDEPVIPPGSRVILLGREAQRMVLPVMGHWQWWETKEFAPSRIEATLIPHPSGKSLVYNDQESRIKVSLLLRSEAMREIARMSHD
jgi:hypothetical protein